MNGMSNPRFLGTLQRLQAVEVRHGIVGDDQVPGLPGQSGIQSLVRLHSFELGRVAAAPQFAQQQLGVGLRILDDQDAQRGGHWVIAFAAAARSTPASKARPGARLP